MANLILPDSNIYIRGIRSGMDPFFPFSEGILSQDWEFATCGLIVLEVCRGLRDQRLFARYRERFSVMIFLPATQQVWERATQLAWTLDRRGIVLPSTDLFIAAHALQAEATVLTYDSHFHSIPGLRVIDRLT